LTIAERLQQMAPQDSKTPKLVTQLTARLKQGPPDPRFPIVPWAPAPKRSQVGAPVQWLGGFRRLRGADAAVEAKLRQHAGTFFVAAGLALQGLGKARMSVNLVRADEAPRLLGALRRFRKTAPVTSAWGLDVGQSALKVIKLGIGSTPDSEVTIQACDHIKYALNLATPEAESQQAELVAQALQTWRERYQPVDDEPVCVNGPASKMLGRFFQIPAIKETKLADLIACEVRHQIPYPLTDLSWGYQVFDPLADPRPADAQADPFRLVVVAALRAGDAKDRLQPFEQLGITVHALQAEPLALYNLVAYDCFSGTGNGQVEENGKLTALLDLGSDISNLVVCSTERVWFRTLRWGGNDANREVVREFKLTFAQAEEVKRRFETARKLAALLDIFDRNSAKLVAEVLRSVEAFQSEQIQQSIDRFWICGGGAHHFGLLRQFRSGSATTMVKTG
jgi:type IV pilus assembly protein PilM